jgi:hypothetical protein
MTVLWSCCCFPRHHLHFKTNEWCSHLHSLHSDASHAYCDNALVLRLTTGYFRSSATSYIVKYDDIVAARWIKLGLCYWHMHLLLLHFPLQCYLFGFSKDNVSRPDPFQPQHFHLWHFCSSLFVLSLQNSWWKKLLFASTTAATRTC